MSCPVFVDSDSNSQLSLLRSFLRNKNIPIEENPAELSVEENLLEVIQISDRLWKEINNEADLEMIYETIISLLIVLPNEKLKEPTLALCQLLGLPANSDKKNYSKLKLLYQLFIGLDDNCVLKYDVYIQLVKLGGEADLLTLVNVRLEDVKEWIKKWNLDVTKYQALLRVLHEVYLNAKLSDRASKVMIELLGTYTAESAAQAGEDARRCIITCIADPSVLLLDHLLLLKPVNFLEGELIHNLVTIFVTSRLVHYLEFYRNHKDFVDNTGLNHENNTKKMRLLTFLSLSESNNELTYEVIQDELQLQPEQVESFIIEVIRSKAAKVKILQPQKKVVVSSALNRTFGKNQWIQLKEKLSIWGAQLSRVTAEVQSLRG